MTSGRRAVGVVNGDTVIELAGVSSLKQLLAEMPEETIANALSKNETRRHAFDQIELLPVVPDPDKTICIGLNYRAHQVASGFEAPWI